MTEREFNIQQKIIKLEKQLEEVKAFNKAAWDTYGSELCAGDMLKREEELEAKIESLKKAFNENSTAD